MSTLFIHLNIEVFGNLVYNVFIHFSGGKEVRGIEEEEADTGSGRSILEIWLSGTAQAIQLKLPNKEAWRFAAEYKAWQGGGESSVFYCTVGGKEWTIVFASVQAFQHSALRQIRVLG